MAAYLLVEEVMNAIEVQCQCGQRFAADANRAGQTLACPVCASPIHIPAAPVAPPRVEVWHGRLADGTLFGPVTRAQLDEAVAAGRLTGDAELWQQGEPAPVRANDVYPQLTKILPVSSAQGTRSTWRERVQQDLDHLSSNPLGYLVGGPKRPRYQRQSVSVAWSVFYLLLLLFVMVAGTVPLGINGVVSLTSGDGESAGLAGAMLLLLYGGIFCLAGSLFQWRFFFESRKAIGARDLLGDRGARYLYIVIGSLFVVIPAIVATVNRAGMFRSQQPVEKSIAEMELQVRTWKIRTNGRVENFQGKLERVSGTGATVLKDGQIVGAKFADFSPDDRQYLRVVFKARGKHFPSVLAPQYDVAFDTPGSSSNRPAALSSWAGWEPGQPMPLGGVRVGAPRVPAPTPGFDRPSPIDPALQSEQRLIDEPLNLGDADEVLIADADPPRALALKRALRETTLRVYDLRSGKQLKQYLLPTDSELVATAADGSRVVLAKNWIHDETLLAVRLGDDATATVEAEWQPHGRDGAAWIRFATPDRLFSGTAQDAQTCWAWPPERPLIEFEKAYRYEFTPGGHFFIERVLEGLQFRNASDGEVAGGLRFESGLNAEEFSVSRDGKRLIVLLARDNSHDELLGCWDLKAGSRMFLVPVSHAARAGRGTRFFHWLGLDYVLCGDVLIRMRDQRDVWRFTQIPPCLDSPDDRLWTIAKYGNETLLMPRTIPDAELVAKFPPPTPPLTVVAAGDRVSLEIDFQAAPPTAEVRSQLQASLEQKMREAGWQVANGQPRKVRAVIQEQNEGGTVLFAGFIPGTKTTSGWARPTGETIEVPNIKLVCALELLGEDGKQWQQMQIRSGPKDVPTQKRQGFQEFTAEMVLNARWDVLVNRVDSSVGFKSEILVHPELASSRLAEPVSHELMAKLAEARRAAELAEAERNKPKIDLPWEREETAWHVEPDPHPALMASTLRGALPVASGNVKDVIFAPEAGHAIVQIEQAGDGAEMVVHRFALREKKRLARTPLPTRDATLLDFRPDGQVWLVQPTPGERKLQVWRCAVGQDVPLVDVKLTDEAAIRQAYFLGRGGVLVNDGEKLFARSLPAGDLVYQHELRASRCYLSWGRKYFVDWSGSRFALYQTSDGKLAGQLAALPNGSRSTSDSALAIRLGYRHHIDGVAFHPDGRTLALLVGRTVGIWDLGDGSLTNWFDVPPSTKTIRWCGPKQLLVDDKLFDLDWEAPIWSYSDFLAASPDGRGWYLSKGPHDVTHLAAITLPSESVSAALDRIKQRVPPLLLPNEGVSLRISVSGEADRREELTDRLTVLFTKLFTDQKIQIRDGERHWLSVSYNMTTDRRDAYRFQRDGAELIVENRLLQANITFSRASSKWEKNITVELPSVDYVIDPDSDDPAGDLHKQQEEHMFDLLQRLSPPIGLPWADDKLFGRSRCDIDGENVSVDSHYRF